MCSLLACSKSMTEPDANKSDPPLDRTKQFVVASYNILHDSEGIPTYYNWNNRKSLLIEQIKNNQVDILCLQEDWDNQALDIQRALDCQSVGRTKRILYDGNRFGLKAQGMFYLSETPDKSSTGWDASGPRHCNWALFQDRHVEQEFIVFNVHFDHIGRLSRDKSALLMKDKIEFIAQGRPVIVTGDFNTRPGTKPIMTMSSTVKDSRAISKTKPEGPLGTFNGMNLNRQYQDRIDYVFLSDHYRVNRYWVAQDATDGIYPSDHFPVLAEVELR